MTTRPLHGSRANLLPAYDPRDWGHVVSAQFSHHPVADWTLPALIEPQK